MDRMTIEAIFEKYDNLMRRTAMNVDKKRPGRDFDDILSHIYAEVARIYHIINWDSNPDAIVRRAIIQGVYFYSKENNKWNNISLFEDMDRLETTPINDPRDIEDQDYLVNDQDADTEILADVLAWIDEGKRYCSYPHRARWDMDRETFDICMRRAYRRMVDG